MFVATNSSSWLVDNLLEISRFPNFKALREKITWFSYGSSNLFTITLVTYINTTYLVPKPNVCSINSIQPTEWEKQIVEARKQFQKKDCFWKLKVFRLLLIVGRSAACRSRCLPAQGQCFPRHGSKEIHRVLKNCVTLDEFALCIFGTLAGRVTLDLSTWNGNKVSPIGLRRSNGVLWWLRQLIRWSASLWAESNRGANTLFGPKDLDGKGEYLTEKKSVNEIHTQREKKERERVENETDWFETALNERMSQWRNQLRDI